MSEQDGSCENIIRTEYKFNNFPSLPSDEIRLTLQ